MSLVKSICVVTGTRADYGLLKWLMKDIDSSPKLELKIIAIGMHLSNEFGLTYKEIERDGFNINKKIEMILSSDAPSGIIKSTGLGMIGLGDAFAEIKPDAIVILGDRYEMLAASFAATVHNIPIVHLHGGEITEGAFDDAIRHSISKMSMWHFVASQDYADIVKQLGENPKRIFNVGGLGVDAIKRTKLLSKQALIEQSKIKFFKKNLLITYHPTTLEPDTSKLAIKNILDVLEELNDTFLIFTMPNSDTDNRIIKDMILKFVSVNEKRSIAFDSMGYQRYVSTLKYVDAVLGNSSSGLLEAPTFKIGTINVGDRQKGRLKAKSVIDCKASKRSLRKAINTLYTENFQESLKSTVNPYGRGKAVKKIIDFLENLKLPKLLKKTFFQL